jgi:site-specific DNA recombinase
MTKAYSYNRVSSKDQEREGFSIPAQLELLRAYARQNSFQIIREFVEAESAGKEGRKAFDQMVDLLRRDPAIKTILVEKTDRLYRNFRDYVLMEDLDVAIHLVKEHEVISKNSRSHAKLVHGIKVVMAKNYLDNLSEEVIKGQRQKAQQGGYPGGVVPIGYVRNRLTGQIEIDPDRAPIIHNLFELYAQGNRSLDDLHSFAKQARLTYPRSGRIIARSEIERMLKKEFYTGKFNWNGTLYQGDHPPMVDHRLFDQVQEVFRRRSNGKFSKRDFPFSRMLTCECGNAVTAEIKKGRYVYYHCTGYGHRHKKVYVSESALDRQLYGIVGKVTLPPDWYDFMKACLVQERKSRKIHSARERERLESIRDRTTTDMKKAFQAHVNGTVSEEFFKSVHNDYQKELDAVNYRLMDLSESVEHDFDIAMKTIELSHQAESLYLRANPDQKRRLLSSVLSNCTLSGATLTPTYKKPFDLLAKGIESQNMRRDWDSNPGDVAVYTLSRRAPSTARPSLRLVLYYDARTVRADRIIALSSRKGKTDLLTCLPPRILQNTRTDPAVLHTLTSRLSLDEYGFDRSLPFCCRFRRSNTAQTPPASEAPPVSRTPSPPDEPESCGGVWSTRSAGNPRCAPPARRSRHRRYKCDRSTAPRR